MNKSVEEVNGADIYYLVYAMHLGRLWPFSGRYYHFIFEETESLRNEVTCTSKC